MSVWFVSISWLWSYWVVSIEWLCFTIFLTVLFIAFVCSTVLTLYDESKRGKHLIMRDIQRREAETK